MCTLTQSLNVRMSSALLILNTSSVFECSFLWWKSKNYFGEFNKLSIECVCACTSKIEWTWTKVAKPFIASPFKQQSALKLKEKQTNSSIHNTPTNTRDCSIGFYQMFYSTSNICSLKLARWATLTFQCGCNTRYIHWNSFTYHSKFSI